MAAELPAAELPASASSDLWLSWLALPWEVWRADKERKRGAPSWSRAQEEPLIQEEEVVDAAAGLPLPDLARRCAVDLLLVLLLAAGEVGAMETE